MATGAPDAGQLVSTAKAWIGPHATEVMQDCVQLHGGIGITWEHDLHLYLRRATVDRMLWGTPEEHAERVAAAACSGRRLMGEISRTALAAQQESVEDFRLRARAWLARPPAPG